MIFAKMVPVQEKTNFFTEKIVGKLFIKKTTVKPLLSYLMQRHVRYMKYHILKDFAHS